MYEYYKQTYKAKLYIIKKSEERKENERKREGGGRIESGKFASPFFSVANSPNLSLKNH